MKSLKHILLMVLAVRDVLSVRLFNSTDQLPANLTEVCKTALADDISCGPDLISAAEVTARLEHNTTVLNSYCNKTCGDSLKEWADNVNTCCGAETVDFAYSAQLGSQPFHRPARELADSLLWAHDVSCLRNNVTGSFCAPELTDSMQECADCTFKYLAAMKSSWYGIGRAPSDKGWKSLLERCCVDGQNYPVANWTMPEPPVPVFVHPIPCAGDCYHTVKDNDTCESIASEYSVAYDRLVYQNGLEWGCRSLAAGSRLCVGNPCALYTIQQNDTCKSIAAGQNATTTELLAWNPSVHRSCDNLGALAGRAICVTPPGSDSYTVNVTVQWWGRHRVAPTWGSWQPGSTAGADWMQANGSALGKRAPLPTMTVVVNSTEGFLQGSLWESL